MAEIEKMNANAFEPGPQGQALGIMNDTMALRVWNEGKVEKKSEHAHDYEVLGYVIDGEAILHSEGKTVHLTRGDSWRVPGGVKHAYEIEESFRAVEVSSPPARGASLGAHGHATAE
ncbi:MAG: cupin domain-containing protein [Parvularcula sp.]|jgi:mannose-6-phosphate isomerase-like protein (cupin superfamily)|nr:cupin domain-containing protein [Parvularcula sp.]